MTSMPPWPRRPVRVGKSRVTPLYLIGVDSLKDAFIARLRIEEPGAGFCHFPVGRGLDYYAGLTSERPLRKYHKGVARRVWIKAPSARNGYWTVGFWRWRRSRASKHLGYGLFGYRVRIGPPGGAASLNGPSCSMDSEI